MRPHRPAFPHQRRGPPRLAPYPKQQDAPRKGGNGKHFIKGLNKVKLLISAVGNRHRVEPEPLVHQGGVGTTEIEDVSEVLVCYALWVYESLSTLHPHRVTSSSCQS